MANGDIFVSHDAVNASSHCNRCNTTVVDVRIAENRSQPRLTESTTVRFSKTKPNISLELLKLVHMATKQSNIAGSTADNKEI